MGKRNDAKPALAVARQNLGDLGVRKRCIPTCSVIHPSSLSHSARLNRRHPAYRLQIFELHDVLSDDQEDPGTKAARKMDWEQFMAGLSARDQSIIEFMVEGSTCPSIARKLGVCDSAIQHRKQRLAVKIQEFMGLDILVQVGRSPQWKQDLQATRDKMACREERKH